VVCGFVVCCYVVRWFEVCGLRFEVYGLWFVVCGLKRAVTVKRVFGIGLNFSERNGIHPNSYLRVSFVSGQNKEHIIELCSWYHQDSSQLKAAVQETSC